MHSVLPRAAFAFITAAAAALAQGHPHFDDGGTLKWFTSLADAKAAAKQHDKLIFIQYGREACGNCRSLVQKVLPGANVKERLAAIAIGLAIDCDAGDDAVGQLLHANLPGAQMLPFVGFVNWDGQWVTGFAGFKDAKAFEPVLEAAEKSPARDATEAVRRQLAPLAASATAAAAARDWKTVLKVARTADASGGRCPERDAIRTAHRQARDWLAEQFAAVFEDAKTGKDMAPSRKRLEEVQKRFAGEPEAAEADLGFKAVRRLVEIRTAEARGNAAKDLRSKAAAQYEKSRWGALFDVAGAAAAAAPK
jgi:hypothetical protein